MPYKDKISGIYIILNKENGKFYIGSSVNIKNRWALHKRQLSSNTHVNNYLQKAWNKYGQKSFLFEIVEICPKEECINRENYWLSYHQTYIPEIGYNIISQANSFLGYKHTEETKQKLKKIAQQKWANMTEEENMEERKKLSSYRKNKAISTRHKKALFEGLLKSGWLQSERKKAMLAQSNTEKISKPVYALNSDLEIIQGFHNARLAVEFLNKGIPSSISTCTIRNKKKINNGELNLFSVHSYIWIKQDDFEILQKIKKTKLL